jgi:plasmid stabilization system protein ParE
MLYRVVLQRLANQDLEEAYIKVAKNAPWTASRWLDRFQMALQTLDTNPERCPTARENAKVSIELREFHFGKKPYVFRTIFTVDGQTVRILRIRRAQRRYLTRQEIDEAASSDE